MVRKGLIEWLQADQQEPSIKVGENELPLAIRRHPRARRMTMRLAPDGSEVRITMPQWGRTRDALVFAHARQEWLETQLAAVPTVALPAAGGSLLYRGRELGIEWDRRLPRTPALFGGNLRLGGPEETIPARLKRWLETEALGLMTRDLAYYCERADIADVPELRLSRAQRRWGSCSGKGCIRINWRLVQAPDHVRRSVVAHEVAHLVHFDHSRAFHALLAELFEGTPSGAEAGSGAAEHRLKDADRWLKSEGRKLYAAFG